MSWRRVSPLLLSGFLLGFGMYVWYSLYPKYLLEIGFEPAWVGYIFTAFWSVTFLTGIPAGRLADVVGRKGPMILGLCISGVSALLLSSTRGELGNLALIGLFSFGVGIFQPSSISYLMESSARRGLVYSSFLVSNFVGTTIGSYMAGLLKTRIGFSILPLLGGSSILLGAASLLFLKDEGGSFDLKVATEEVKGSFGSSLRLLKDWRVRLLVFALLIHTFGYYMLSAFIPPYAAYGIGLDDYQIGIVVAASQVAMASSFIFMGKLVDRLGGALVLLMHVALSTLSWSFYALSGNFLVAIMAMAFSGMVSSMDFPARRVLVADLSNESEMASLLGTVDAATGMGMLVAPSVGAYLWSEVGYSSPFFVASLINLGAIPLLLKLYRSIRR